MHLKQKGLVSDNKARTLMRHYSPAHNFLRPLHPVCLFGTPSYFSSPSASSSPSPVPTAAHADSAQYDSSDTDSACAASAGTAGTARQPRLRSKRVQGAATAPGGQGLAARGASPEGSEGAASTASTSADARERQRGGRDSPVATSRRSPWNSRRAGDAKSEPADLLRSGAWAEKGEPLSIFEAEAQWQDAFMVRFLHALSVHNLRSGTRDRAQSVHNLAC